MAFFLGGGAGHDLGYLSLAEKGMLGNNSGCMLAAECFSFFFASNASRLFVFAILQDYAKFVGEESLLHTKNKLR